MLKHTRNTNDSEILFYKQMYSEQHCTRKLQKCWTHNIAFKIISKMLKQASFFHSQPSARAEEAFAKFYLSMTFWLSFMISSVAPTRSSTSYSCLITKIGNRNFKQHGYCETNTSFMTYSSNTYLGFVWRFGLNTFFENLWKLSKNWVLSLVQAR